MVANGGNKNMHTIIFRLKLLIICGLINFTARRQPNLHESPGSSEYSTGSTIVSQAVEEKIDQSQPEIGTHHQEAQNNIGESEKEILLKTTLERGNE